MQQLAFVFAWLYSTELLAQEKLPEFKAPDDIAYRSENVLSDGTRIAAEVFALRTSAAEKLPTIVMSHGWGGTASALRPDAVVFARAGYLVVAFDYRGWGDSDSRLVKEELFENKDHVILAHERATGVKKLVTIPGITHYGIYKEARSHTQKEAIAWFDEHLK